MDREFYGNATKPFKYLETLTFEGMPKWEEWVSLEGEDEIEDFPALRELHIIECPKLIRDLISNLRSLTVLEIRDCQQLVASLPRAPTLHELHLTDCNENVEGITTYASNSLNWTMQYVSHRSWSTHYIKIACN